MAKRKLIPVQTKSRFINYSISALSADTDFVEIRDMGNYSKVAIEISGITADTIEVYGYLAYDKDGVLGNGQQIFDADGVNPFTVDTQAQINSEVFAGIRIVRNGGTDGDITGYISLSY